MIVGLFLFWSIAEPAGSTEPKQITNDGLFKFAPTYTAGGTEIVYAVHNVPNRVSLTRLSLEAGSSELLYPDMPVHQFDPAYSADGRFHAYCRSSGSPQMLLVIVDTKSKTEAIFTPTGARSTARTPRILPEANHVVFTLSAPGGQQIVSVDMQGKDLKRLTETTGINCWPSVSPDGQSIVFSSSRDGHLQLYTMKVDGSSVERLTETPVRDMRPSWSPDGRRIAFTSVRDGNHEIYVIDADGTHLRRITNHPERDDFAVWHPDGQHLLCVSQRDGRYDLWLFEVDR
jgi:Tol biopolymer transport system component